MGRRYWGLKQILYNFPSYYVKDIVPLKKIRIFFLKNQVKNDAGLKLAKSKT